MQRGTVGACTAALVLATAGCGSSGVTADIADDLVANSQGAISDSEAECAAEVIVDALGESQAQVYAAALAGDLDAAAESEPLTEEQQAAMSDGFMDCDFDLFGGP